MGCQNRGPNYIKFSVILTDSGRIKKVDAFKNKYELLFSQLQKKYDKTKKTWDCKKI